MSARWNLTVDCADPDRMARFWMTALHYRAVPPPDGFDTWSDYWRSIGVPEEELGEGIDRIEDPDGQRPRIWFQVVPEGKTVKNRLHLDITVSGMRTVAPEVRQQQVDTEVARLVEAGATVLRYLNDPGIDHYAVVLQDPELNEFCVN
jgi:hypothetical protein